MDCREIYRETYGKIIAVDTLPTHREVMDLLQFSERNCKEGNGKVNRELFGSTYNHLFARQNDLGGYDGGLWNQVYHVWTEEFIDILARHIISRGIAGPAVEIGAGDGKLSHWLRKKGIDIIATDDNSEGHWSEAIRKGQSWPVVKMDYVKALRTYQPACILTSWLPPPQPIDENSPRIQEAIIDHPTTRGYVEIRGTLSHVDCTGIIAQHYQEFSITHPEALQRCSIPVDIMARLDLDPSDPEFQQKVERSITNMRTVASWTRQN